MGSQSTAKTIFLLSSMVGWLIFGAALMYLSPVLADYFFPSDLTHLWVINLGRGRYNPILGWGVGGIALTVNVAANFIWYRWFDGKL